MLWNAMERLRVLEDTWVCLNTLEDAKSLSSLKRLRTPKNALKCLVTYILNHPFSKDGKSRERHVTLRHRSVLVTRESCHGDGTIRRRDGTERRRDGVISEFS